MNVQFLRRVNMRMRLILNLLFLNKQLVHMFRIFHLQITVGVILHIVRVSHLSKKGGGFPHFGRQTTKILGSKGVSVDEFFDDISKSKRKYSYALS